MNMCHDKPLEALHDGGCQSCLMVVIKPLYLAFLWDWDDSDFKVDGVRKG